MWKTSEKLENILDKISFVLNTTKIENQNNLRTLMLQLGKLAPKESTFRKYLKPKRNSFITNLFAAFSDEPKLVELGEKLDTNFGKLLLKQDLFLESCYKLQMDESQLETKISDILEKLISTFEEKYATSKNDYKTNPNLI